MGFKVFVSCRVVQKTTSSQEILQTLQMADDLIRWSVMKCHVIGKHLFGQQLLISLSSTATVFALLENKQVRLIIPNIIWLNQFCSKITTTTVGHWKFLLNNNECTSFIIVHPSAYCLLLTHPVFKNIYIPKTQPFFPCIFKAECIKYLCIKIVSD